MDTFCLQSNIPSINFEDNGRSYHEEYGLVKTVWFVGPQLPPSMTKYYKTNRKVSKKIDGYQADTESDVEPAPKKSRNERTRKSATKECKHQEDYNLSGDDDSFQARESIEHNE